MPFAEQYVRQALDRNEVFPHFQPIVDIRTGHLHGFEVLARWSHPVRGLVAPPRFIPVFERYGLINDLTRCLLQQAFASVRSLPAAFGLSINLAPAQLHDRTLPAFLERLAGDACFDLKRLTVELTESALVDDVELAGIVARDMKKLGVRLALDDFGTGYSSLLHLQALPFDELKVDISFVREMVTSRQSRKITAAVINLGVSLGLQTVAEGVEDAAQLNLLAWQGCNLAQGYLFGRPVPADQLAEELARNHPGFSMEAEPSAPLTSLSVTLDANPVDRLSELRAIYDSAPVGLAFLDRNLAYVSLNRRLAELNGISVQCHLRRKIADVLPDSYPHFEQFLHRALAGEELRDVEFQRPSAVPGQPDLSILASYQPVRDEAGEVLGICVSVADISSVKQREAALRESEDHYRHSVELNPQAPWLMDAQGNNIACSPRWEAMTGFKPEQTSGYGWMDALHPDDRLPVLQSVRASLASGNLMDLHYRICDCDGVWRWMRSRGAPRRNAAGEITRWYGSVESIDEYKRTLDDLRGSEARMRAIFNAAPAGIVLAESATGRVLDANPHAEELLGFHFIPSMSISPERWQVTDTCGHTIATDDLPLMLAMRGIDTTVPQRIHILRPDGTGIWVKATASAIRFENGDLLGGVLVVQQIDPISQPLVN